MLVTQIFFGLPNYNSKTAFIQNDWLKYAVLFNGMTTFYKQSWGLCQGNGPLAAIYINNASSGLWSGSGRSGACSPSGPVMLHAVVEPA